SVEDHADAERAAGSGGERRGVRRHRPHGGAGAADEALSLRWIVEQAVLRRHARADRVQKRSLTPILRELLDVFLEPQEELFHQLRMRRLVLRLDAEDLADRLLHQLRVALGESFLMQPLEKVDLLAQHLWLLGIPDQIDGAARQNQSREK